MPKSASRGTPVGVLRIFAWCYALNLGCECHGVSTHTFKVTVNNVVGMQVSKPTCYINDLCATMSNRFCVIDFLVYVIHSQYQ